MENQNENVTPPVHQPPVKHGMPVILQVFLGVLLAVILIAVGAGAAYYIMQKSPTVNKPVTANTNAAAPSNCVPGSLDCVNTSTGELPPIASTTEAQPATSSNETSNTVSSDVVSWSAPSKLASLKLFTDEKTSLPKYYKVGQFTSGKYSGYDVILVAYAPSGPSYSDVFCRFARKGSELVMLKNHCSEYYKDDGFATSKFTVDATYKLPGFDFPAILTSANPTSSFNKEEWAFSLFNAAKIKPAFTSQYGQVYVTNGFYSDFSDPFVRNGFYIKAPDGTTAVYSLKIPFMEKSYDKPAVTWNDGTVSEDTYDYTDFTGCGSVSYASVVSPAAVKDSDLVVAGKTASNENIYLLADSKNALLKNMYDKEYQIYNYSNEKKATYEEFIKGKPLFFWKDPFGRLIKFKNTKFGTGAECGKPVIYLYPEKTTAVSVRLDPQGGFTYTEPAYNSGWNVTAEPSGQLTNSSDKKVYPYLFWEGRGGYYQAPQKGFVVAQKDVHSFLVEKLAKLGLNAKETSDFIEFWEPRMQGSPYYFVSFYGNAVMDELAPLNISPKPDTIIRILMDFQPLAKPVKVQGYDIKTPERKGFTAVEWGGVLR